MWVTVAVMAIHGLIRLKKFVSRITTKLWNQFCFRLHLMLYAYVQRFYVIDKKFLGGELNKAWLSEANHHQSREINPLWSWFRVIHMIFEWSSSSFIVIVTRTHHRPCLVPKIFKILRHIESCGTCIKH